MNWYRKKSVNWLWSVRRFRKHKTQANQNRKNIRFRLRNMCMIQMNKLFKHGTRFKRDFSFNLFFIQDFPYFRRVENFNVSDRKVLQIFISLVDYKILLPTTLRIKNFGHVLSANIDKGADIFQYESIFYAWYFLLKGL